MYVFVGKTLSFIKTILRQDTHIFLYLDCQCVYILHWLVARGYRDKTGKMLSLQESLRPLTSTVLLSALMITWARYSSYDIIEKHPRIFFLTSGTVFSNIAVCTIGILSCMYNWRIRPHVCRSNSNNVRSDKRFYVTSFGPIAGQFEDLIACESLAMCPNAKFEVLCFLLCSTVE